MQMAAALARDDVRAALERELSAALVAVAPELREVLIERFAKTLQHLVDSERKRCAELCRARAALWRATPHNTWEGRSEIRRARVNEAEYLADAIETPPELLPPAR
jgi:hypothetical protein